MPLLIGNAACFVFPSRLEACGHVLLEALACGTPVLCCRRRPMTDICGEAGVFFDGENPGDIADKIRQVLSDASLRERLAHAGPAQAAQFSWRESAAKVHGIFTQLNSAPSAATREAAAVPPGRKI
jgi:glycosyltransferase involved in cell wall biosynthesis